MKKTTYQIINQGHSISPDKNRDEYYEEEWIKVEDVLKKIDEHIKKYEHCRDSCESGELDALEELKRSIKGEGEWTKKILYK